MVTNFESVYQNKIVVFYELHTIRIVNSPSNEIQGVKFFGRAKPLPMTAIGSHYRRTLGGGYLCELQAPGDPEVGLRYSIS